MGVHETIRSFMIDGFLLGAEHTLYFKNFLVILRIKNGLKSPNCTFTQNQQKLVFRRMKKLENTILSNEDVEA